MAEKKDIQVLLAENRVFEPSPEIVKNSNVKAWMDKHGLKTLDELLAKCQDIDWYWKEMADELLDFYKPYDKVLEWDPPYAKWFVGGQYNIVHDALDRSVTLSDADRAPTDGLDWSVLAREMLVGYNSISCIESGNNRV